jgi:hypothetical protein
MNFLSEKKYGVPSHNFVRKNVLCEKGDEITRFDGTQNRLRICSKYLNLFGEYTESIEAHMKKMPKESCRIHLISQK